MIDQYGADLIDDLSTFTPSQVCASVGLCATPDSAAAAQKTPTKNAASSTSTSFTSARRLLAEKHGIKLAFDDARGDNDAVGGPVACNTCKLAVTYAKSMLAENATRVQVLDEMKSLCDLIPNRGGEAAVDCASLLGGDVRGKPHTRSTHPSVRFCRRSSLSLSVFVSIRLSLFIFVSLPVALCLSQFPSVSIRLPLYLSVS